MKNDNYYIQRCEELGKKAAAEGNSKVGAVIIKGDEIISEAAEAGFSKNDVTCHAEIEAIRLAVNKLKTNDLSECILYSTHEPCVMCSYTIRFYKIKKIVFQHPVKYLGGVTSSMPVLTTNNVPTHWGSAPVIVNLDNSEMKNNINS